MFSSRRAQRLIRENGEQAPDLAAALQTAVQDARRILAAGDSTVSQVMTAGNVLEQQIGRMMNALRGEFTRRRDQHAEEVRLEDESPLEMGGGEPPAELEPEPEPDYPET